MVNQISNFQNNTLFPNELLHLFLLHQHEIINSSNKLSQNYLVKETEEEYHITSQSILNNAKYSKSFSELLFYYIDNSNLTDVEVYKNAYLDRRLFSKIKSNRLYHPSFGTVVLLALSLKLSTKDFETLLHSASYSLPQNTYVNITLRYCFDNKIYDISKVNSLIFEVSNKEIKDL